jgi:hypothetical protein
MKKEAERLEWIANDYLHLAQDADVKSMLCAGSNTDG